MSSIGVNPPKTPVTEGSSGKSPATMPNVCKMPGPPAPFVPSPLPNVGQSSDHLDGGTTTVLFLGKKVAIKGSSFKSALSGDAASQGTGGGIVSSQTQGKTEWVAPGSIDVKAEGKNIQLLGDAMTNNGGSPANSATMMELQDPDSPAVFTLSTDCDEKKKDGSPKWDDCQKEELCTMIAEFNKIPKDKIKLVRPSPSSTIPQSKASEYFSTVAAYEEHVVKYNQYMKGLSDFKKKFADTVNKQPTDEKAVRSMFYTECRYEQWKNGKPPRAPNPPANGPAGVNPDHVHDAGLNGPLDDIDGLKWVNYKINSSLGRSLGSAAERGDYKPGMKVEAPKCCP